MTIHDFDAIRPYQPEELPAAFDQLLADTSFCTIAQSFFKDMPFDMFKKRLYACKDSLEVQKVFFYPLIKQLLQQCSKGATMDASAIAPDLRCGCFTFVSNHRDIVLDPALLDILLVDNAFRTTVEIAIGDNLLIYPWIKTLVRINKSFIVQRSVGIREMLASSKRMSQYMHFAINQKKENIWIAQREGRAKDSNDRTQESVLKMMAMGGEGSPLDSLKEMNIIPLSISYEYDPCDYLKAKEFQLKRDIPDFKKSPNDDLQNMHTGIFGYKGHVNYRIGTPINTWIDELAGLNKTDFFKEVALRIDQSIHKGYEIYANNYIALDMLNGNNKQNAHYTDTEKTNFEQYLNKRIEAIDIENKDIDYLRNKILVMYANPLINYLKATQS